MKSEMYGELPKRLTYGEFRTRMHALGANIDMFATITGQNISTVRGWGRNRNGRDQVYPLWVTLLTDAWLALGGVPVISTGGQVDDKQKSGNETGKRRSRRAA